MKRIAFLLLAAVMTFGLASCEHQTMNSAEVVVYPNQWVKPASADYYMARFQCDLLDQDVVNYGMVNVYLVQNGRQDMLPFVYPIDCAVYDDATGEVAYYETVGENLRYNIAFREITFILQDLDGNLPDDMENIPAMRFRIVTLGD